MFDIGWMEMLVIAVVAIVVIGPKDLPRVLHTVGQWMSRARAVARTFQDQMEEMARQSGVDDVRKEIQSSLQGVDPAKRLQDMIDPRGEMDAQMKAMADVGRIDPATPEIAPPQALPKAGEEVAAASGEAEAGRAPANPHALPDDLIAEDKKPESPLQAGDTSYKGPAP